MGNTTAIWNETPVDLANARPGSTPAPARATRSGGERPAAKCSATPPTATGDPSRASAHVEHSVYVRDDQRGKGLGVQLLQALIERARAQGLHVMVAAIESGNAASIGLHRPSRLRDQRADAAVGQKFGRWLDLTFMQLNLDPTRSAP
ncbi:acetyltransferase family protein [Pseudomonas aeruginosa]|uniref:GNAT family N-acetyltransferase n=1 Tax=Pseudomonas aeruginosa TaxID=287 RepID=UPI000DFB4C0E|nr:GNAT family N-acetyltransferase [Pseudomonas aeruginosa]RCH25243.1 acetyltransferase family protein [Pseudomonas aeruginosa]